MFDNSSVEASFRVEQFVVATQCQFSFQLTFQILSFIGSSTTIIFRNTCGVLSWSCLLSWILTSSYPALIAALFASDEFGKAIGGGKSNSSATTLEKQEENVMTTRAETIDLLA